MDEFICDGIDFVETDYEGKHFENYWVYGHKDGQCKFFGIPYCMYKIAKSKEADLLHGKEPKYYKGRRGRVAYDKYKNPSYFIWESTNEL